MEDVMKLLAPCAEWSSLPLFLLLVLIYFNLKSSLPSSISVLEKPMYNLLTSEIYTLMTLPAQSCTSIPSYTSLSKYLPFFALG